MQETNPSQYIFNTHIDAEEAIRSLGKSGFDVKKLSLIGKGYSGGPDSSDRILSSMSGKIC
jgi:hypothetical protein